MKKTLLIAAAMFLGLGLSAQNAPLWMRHSTISPDGSAIAFTYKGDIFTVPAAGGRATRITTHAAQETNPVWSKDSKSIAFSSDRAGSMDIYIVSKEGGAPKRLTSFSGGEFPIAFKDNNTLMFAANIMPSAESMQFPSGIFNQIYTIPVDKDYLPRPEMFSSLPMECISWAKDGKTFLYHDKKGYEDPMRKHHTSSITRDIWMCRTNGQESAGKWEYTKITAFNGEDRNPVFTPDNKEFYYLSEKDGTFNVWKAPFAADGEKNAKQITRFKGNPVRFLSMAGNGTLCFGQDGEIYTLAAGASHPQKVKIQIIADQTEREVIKNRMSMGAEEMSVSKDGKQIAFIFHGDVYVTSSEYKTTKQITDTPEQERNVEISPDGRSVIYASERDGLWQIYRTSIVNEDEKYFPYATELKEERLTKTDKVSFQPQFSPDGKEIAFLQDRTGIAVLNLKSGKIREVMNKKFGYSYSDGDQSFEWSPDGKWILATSIMHGGWCKEDIALVDASGNGKMTDLTKSGYSNGAAKWVLGGKAMIWASDKAGMRSHGSWGSQYDIYMMFFDLEAYEKFRMNKEELALCSEAEKLAKEKEAKEAAEKEKKEKSKKDGKKDGKKDNAADKEKEEDKPLELDIENSEFRVVRLTTSSCSISDAVLSPEGDQLYYIATFNGNTDLWVRNLKTGDLKVLVPGCGKGSLIIDGSGSTIYMCAGGGIMKISTAGGQVTPVKFEAEFNYKPYAEREYIFDHTWRQVKEKFYDENIHGVDWEGYKKTYARFLPHISNNHDFAEMLSEMLGELNASHTGASYMAMGNAFSPVPAAIPTASLGIFTDDTHKGDGIRIKEIIKRSPLAVIKTKVTEGCIIEKIDGKEILAGREYFSLLEGKAGRPVRLTVYNPSTKERFDETIKPLSNGRLNDLLYYRWVERNRSIVEKISGGRIGYIHIKDMDSDSFRTLYSELLGRYRDMDAIVIDTRHNGGGWLHDDVLTLLTGKLYGRFMPRGQFIGDDPYNKWTKPSCMLICEDNYSNAHGTPWLYKELKAGKLVGAPVPGTMTAVWWEQQMDPSLVFGIPQVGYLDNRGKYLENQLLVPDITVYNKPADVLNGQDDQLEKAVRSLM